MATESLLQSELDAVFGRGLSLHQQGQIAQAKRLYEQVLASEPRHAGTLHLLGVIAYQDKTPGLAVELINKAIEINPDTAAFYSNLGNALKDLNRLDDALARYDQALSLKPDYAGAHYNRGKTLQELNRTEEAVASYDNAILLSPDFAEAHNNRGSALRALKRIDEAIDAFGRAIALNPDYAHAIYNLGSALQDLGRFDDALASYERVLTIKPDYSEAHVAKGNALKVIGRLQEAVDCYDNAIEINPTDADAYNNRGNALRELKRVAEGLESYDRCLAIRPDYAQVHYNRGIALQELDRFAEALQSYDRAIAIKPDYADAHYNRGNALQELSLTDQAVASYDTAIALRPDFVEAHNNRGMALQDLHRMDEALASFDRALEKKISYTNCYWNKSLALLLMGEFKQGWQLYEWRWQKDGVKESKRGFSQPLWLGGQEIAGKTLLLHAEQGLGDTIQFCRYARLVSERGAQVVLQVQRPLAQLLGSLQGPAKIIGVDEQIPPFDMHCPLMSLPMALGTIVETVPTASFYLTADPHLVQRWAALLGPKRAPRIGLCWSGNAMHRNDRKRSLALSQLLAALPLGFEYISLQKDLRVDDQQTLHDNTIGLRHFGADFGNTAALCTLMDLIISVDTSVAHLAGALGMPTWLLLPFAPDFRWLLDRTDSPWYPSFTLLRQPAPDDWDSVLHRVGSGLTQRLQEA